jgi:hypothetical protein
MWFKAFRIDVWISPFASNGACDDIVGGELLLRIVQASQSPLSLVPLAGLLHTG